MLRHLRDPINVLLRNFRHCISKIVTRLSRLSIKFSISPTQRSALNIHARDDFLQRVLTLLRQAFSLLKNVHFNCCLTEGVMI